METNTVIEQTAKLIDGQTLRSQFWSGKYSQSRPEKKMFVAINERCLFKGGFKLHPFQEE